MRGCLTIILVVVGLMVAANWYYEMKQPGAGAPKPMATVAKVRTQPVTIDPGVFKPYDEINFPKLFAVWGEAGIARIQDVRERGAAAASESTACDHVEISEYSEKRSSLIDDLIVVFIDCRNRQRFYFSDRSGLELHTK